MAFQRKPFDPGNGKIVGQPDNAYGNMLESGDGDPYYKKQGQLGRFKGQTIEDMRASGMLDYHNEDYAGGYAMDLGRFDSDINQGKIRMQRGQFTSYVDADSREGRDYLRQQYSDRYRANKKAKFAAVKAEQVGFDYTDPHTGEVFKAKSGYEAPQSDMPAIDVTPQMQAQRDSGGNVDRTDPRYIRRTPEQRRRDEGREIKGSELTNRQRIRLSKGGNKAARQRNRLQRQADRRENRRQRRLRRGR